jgi:ribosome-associated translation inhibitor RaiA
MLQRVSGVRVSGKNLDIGQALRGQAEERVHDAVAKYFDGGFRSQVTVEKEGTGFRADCTRSPRHRRFDAGFRIGP